MKIRFRRPSPALCVAVLALLVAMGGSAVALQRGQSGDTLITKRTLSGNRLRLDTLTGKEVANLSWHNLTLINNWHRDGDFHRPAWAVDVQGIVHLRGAMHESAPTSNEFAILPASIRPTKDVDVETGATNAAPARLILMPSGAAFVQDTNSGVDASGFTSLDGVTYSR